jgi:hypothetical protein
VRGLPGVPASDETTRIANESERGVYAASPFNLKNARCSAEGVRKGSSLQRKTVFWLSANNRPKWTVIGATWKPHFFD